MWNGPLAPPVPAFSIGYSSASTVGGFRHFWQPSIICKNVEMHVSQKLCKIERFGRNIWSRLLYAELSVFQKILLLRCWQAS